MIISRATRYVNSRLTSVFISTGQPWAWVLKRSPEKSTLMSQWQWTRSWLTLDWTDTKAIWQEYYNMYETSLLMTNERQSRSDRSLNVSVTIPSTVLACLMNRIKYCAVRFKLHLIFYRQYVISGSLRLHLLAGLVDCEWACNANWNIYVLYAYIGWCD